MKPTASHFAARLRDGLLQRSDLCLLGEMPIEAMIAGPVPHKYAANRIPGYIVMYE